MADLTWRGEGSHLLHPLHHHHHHHHHLYLFPEVVAHFPYHFHLHSHSLQVVGVLLLHLQVGEMDAGHLPRLVVRLLHLPLGAGVDLLHLLLPKVALAFYVLILSGAVLYVLSHLGVVIHLHLVLL